MRISDWSSDVCSSDLLDDESLHRLIEEEIGGFLKLTMARYDREARQEFSDQLIIELAEVPLSLVAPALAEARRKLAYPERLVPLLFDFIEARWSTLKTAGERLAKRIGRGSCRERVCTYVMYRGVGVTVKKKN